MYLSSTSPNHPRRFLVSRAAHASVVRFWDWKVSRHFRDRPFQISANVPTAFDSAPRKTRHSTLRFWARRAHSRIAGLGLDYGDDEDDDDEEEVANASDASAGIRQQADEMDASASNHIGGESANAVADEKPESSAPVPTFAEACAPTLPHRTASGHLPGGRGGVARAR
jgi:hypothetical protein